MEDFAVTDSAIDKTTLLSEMDAGWVRLDTFVGSLSDEQLTGPTDESGWTVKDHLDHLGVWANGMAAAVSHQSRAGAMGLDDETFATADIDDINEIIRQAGKDKSATQVKSDLAAAHQSLRDTTAGLSEEELHKPYRWFVPEAEGDYGASPIHERITGNSHGHYDEHLGWMLGIIGPPVP